MIHPAQNIISHLTPANHIFLQHGRIPQMIDFSLKEGGEIQEVVKGAAVLADALIRGHLRDDWLVDELPRQNLVVFVVLLVEDHRLRRRTKRPQGHDVVGNVVVEVGLSSTVSKQNTDNARTAWELTPIWSKWVVKTW